MIDNINFKIGDYYELLALHKALLEAKFHQEPNNIEVCFSPIVAKLSNEIVDACKALLSPFLTTQNDIELFIEEVEQKMEGKK